MGQKVNPISNRLGIIRGWDSNWYGGNKYGDTLYEDSKIRKYLNARLSKASVSRIVIERTLKLVTITVCTARPGIIIGKGGQEVDKLKEELKKITDKEIQINIFEVKKPELDAVIVANNIARQLEGKMAYRRAIKTAIAATMRSAEGIKVQISGRLNGAEMARSEMYKEGRTPLHTLRADIDYALGEALTKVGLLGIKVWICRGEVYGKRDLAPQFAGSKDSGNRNDRNDRGGNRGERNDRGERGDRGDRGERGDRGGDRRNNNRRPSRDKK
jgi:small subunit ribosomal protein S3